MTACQGQTLRYGLLTYGLDRARTGIGRYAVELARAIHRLGAGVELETIDPFAPPVRELASLYPSARIRGRLLPTLMVAGAPQIAYVAARRRYALVHDPMGVSPFLIPRRVASFARIVTIHDMTPFVYPESHTWLTNLLFRHFIPRTLPFVDRIVTDSAASKRDIERLYRFLPNRITVIPCGVAEAFRPPTPDGRHAVLANYGLGEGYLLTVGSLQPRKNLETIINAYGLLRQRGFSQPLVIVGKEAWKSAGPFRRIRELGLEASVLLTGYVPDADLPALYAGSAAFVFASLYEGFGLPPLEAMACGAPVVTSNSSSLPEVVGDAGIMIDPLDVHALTEALVCLLSNPVVRADYRARGLARARNFTWERSARKHVAVYKEISAINAGTTPMDRLA